MSDDRYVEVTHQSWFSRMGNAIKGILFGVILFIVAFPLLFWNEGRAVHRAKALEEGAGQVVSLTAPIVEAGNNGKLVHVAGMVKPDGVLEDALFQVSSESLRLIRVVEMYQWQETSRSETKKEVGGGTETVTTYSYNKGWHEQAIDSSYFKKPEGHRNPGTKEFDSQTLTTPNATLGEFRLQAGQVSQIGRRQSLPVDHIPDSLQGRAMLSGGGIYIGASSQQPQVGDLRIRFYTVPAQDASLVAQQEADRLQAFTTTNGERIELVETGVHSAQSMFQAAQNENTIQTWIIRLVGFVIMALGLSMVLRPISVMADVLPFLGNLAEMGIGLVSFLIALTLSCITIAIAWIVYRPLIGVVLLAVAVGNLIVFKKKLPETKPAVEAQS